MSKLYLITGPAGVGKSTVSKCIADNLKKSALIEGDDIYNLVKGGRISPWLEGNQLDIFWKNSLTIIRNFINDGYDVVFNYIIEKDKLEIIQNSFEDVEIIFVVLMVDEKTIITRDKERPLDCQMGERSILLLKDFENMEYEVKHILDTSSLGIEETFSIIKDDKRFMLN